MPVTGGVLSWWKMREQRAFQMWYTMVLLSISHIGWTSFRTHKYCNDNGGNTIFWVFMHVSLRKKFKITWFMSVRTYVCMYVCLRTRFNDACFCICTYVCCMYVWEQGLTMHVFVYVHVTRSFGWTPSIALRLSGSRIVVCEGLVHGRGVK